MSNCEIKIENGKPVGKTYPKLMQDLLVYTDFNVEQTLDLYGVSLLDKFKDLGIQNPNINNVLGFVEQDYINASGRMSKENKQIMLDLSLNSRSDIDVKEEFLKVFSVDGKFGINIEALSDSKIFSKYDVLDLDNHVPKLKELYYKLNNTDATFNTIQNKYIIENNSISKQNPDVFIQNLYDNYTGMSTEDEILDKAREVGDEILLNNTSIVPMILEDVSGKQNLVQYETNEFEGEVQKKTTNNILTELEQTLDVSQNYSELSNILEYTMSNPSLENIRNIEEYAKNLGINLLGLQELYSSKSMEDTVDFLNTLYNLIYDIQTENPEAQESLMEYSERYNEYFMVEPEFANKTVDKIEKNGVFLHLETNQSEEQIFAKKGLLKVSGNTYQKVTDDSTLEELYNVIFTNKGLLPKKTYSVAVKESNRDLIMEDIDKYISNEAKRYLNEDSDTEVLKKIVVYKLLTGIQNEEPTGKAYGGRINLDINDFLVRFNKFLLKNPELKQRFYFSNRGLEAKGYLGEYTAMQLENNLEPMLFEDLVAYSKLSGNESLQEFTKSENTEQPENLRNFYANNLEQLPIFSGEFYKKNGYVVTESNLEFIRFKNELYENVAPNVFAKVERDSRYVNQNLEKPNYDNSVEPKIPTSKATKISVKKTNKINNDQIEFC